MKTFKEFLIEEEDRGVTPMVNAIIAGFIPFGQGMWERITGKEPIEYYGMHVTGLEGIEKIGNKIQGTKKQLPVTTKPDAEIINLMNSGGILTSGGYFAIVKGTLVAQFEQDVNSFRDEQGRRWVDVTKVPVFASHFDWSMDVLEIQDNIYSEVIESQDGNPSNQNKYGGYEGYLKSFPFEEYDIEPTSQKEYIRTEDVKNFPEIFTLAMGASGKEKAAAISMYIDSVESLLKSDKYRVKLEDLFKNVGGSHKWDEMFLVDVEVIKVLADEESYDDYMDELFPDKKSEKSWMRKNKFSRAKLEFYRTNDNKKQILEDELRKIEKLNNRIKLNLNKKFDFPVEY